MSAITREQWVSQIAEKTGRGVDEVEALLKRHGIEPRLTHAIPRRLRLVDLKFEGTKTGEYETSAIDFSLENMGVGLHAFVSSKNFKGKTSLLKIIRWALTGTRTLPSDMNGWFRTLSLRFNLDNDEFEVRLDDAEQGVGKLVKFVRGKEFEVARFEDPKTFAEAMDSFFLKELGLDSLEVIAEREDGTSVDQRHGWNWLFGAMWFEPDPSTLFGGSDISHGKPTRMMQMYLGLPWIMTRASLMEARKREQNEGDQKAKAQRQVSDAARTRLDELNKSRSKIVAGQSKERPVADVQRAVSDALTKFMAAAEKVRKNIILVAEIDGQRRAAEDAVTASSRELSAFLESQAAGHIFRRLNPVSCPSCEEVYDEDVRTVRQDHHDCIVCGRAEPRGPDESAGVEAELREAVKIAKEEAKKLRTRLADFTRKKTEAEAERDRYDQESRRLEQEMRDIQSRPDGQMELLKLDAQIEELEKMAGDPPTTAHADVGLLDAAITATEKMYREEQTEVLGRVSELTAKFAQTFGITDLREVKLKGNTNMDVFFVGGPKTFSKCTSGEKTRLKLAATLAMIHVAEESGIGRHPGVLLLDSVGSAEVVNEDVSQIIEGLGKLSEALPTVQVFLAGIENDAILSHVPCDNVVKNRADGYLW
ncbi:putative large ATP-binding protein [Rhizobium sp. UR51a]|nr:putative large ATP-binding protein [Rhizobium sp. UR51a]